ncbi:MAG: SH3 domain-containing protein, partial [Lachnospiraceae bacterium]|nr:SH3 domain-containing protein [Lachnospiraceae bacterium]
NIVLMLLIFVMLVFGRGICVQAAPEVTETEGTGKITTESLNVRSGPGKEYEAIGKVYSEDTVKITGSTDGWYRIVYDGSEGYVAADYVSADIDVEESRELTDVVEETEEEEIDTSSTGLARYKLPLIILVVILIMIVIIFITLNGIRKMDEDDEDDDYEEDDDDDYDYEEKTVRRQVKQQPRTVYDLKKEIPTLSDNPDDYRIDIDPIFFEDEKKSDSRSNKDEDLKRAMQKIEELQREIERIKNEE